MALQSELNFDGSIKRVEYQAVDTVANAPFREFEMRLCHTPLTELTTSFSGNYGGRTPELVASANPLILNTTADQWFALDCSPAFAYNGVDNLLVEVRWRNGQTETAVPAWGYVAANNRLLYATDYNASSGSVSPKTDRLRITYEAVGVEGTSLGRVRALFR